MRFECTLTHSLSNVVNAPNEIKPGGGVLPYITDKLYRYVPPHRVGFLRGFGLKTGLHFAHFGLKSGIVFEGTTGVYKRVYRFSSK